MFSLLFWFYVEISHVRYVPVTDYRILISTILRLAASVVLEVECWSLVPKFAGSNPAEAVGFFGAKENPQHAFLRKGSKAIWHVS